MKKNNFALDQSSILVRVGILPIAYAIISIFLLVIYKQDDYHGYSEIFSLINKKVFLTGIIIFSIIWAIVRLIQSYKLENQGKSLEKQAIMRAIGRYFKFKTNLSTTLALLALSLIIPVTGSFSVAITLAIVYVIYTLVTMPTDAQIDEWVTDKMQNHEIHGLDALNFDSDELVSNNLSINGIGIAPGITTYVRNGSDKKARYSMLGFTTVYFSADLLLVYYKVIDLINEEIILEQTEEYFYNDVVSLETVRSLWSKEISNEGKFLTFNPWKIVVSTFMLLVNLLFKNEGWTRELRMQTKGGNIFRLYVSEQGSNRNMAISQTEQQIDRALKALRKMLREKKSVN